MSTTYRIAVGPQAGRKVSGFSQHAGVSARADERKKLERLCRYIALYGCRVLRRLGTIASAAGRQYRKGACR